MELEGVKPSSPEKQQQLSGSAYLINPWKVDFVQGAELRKSSNRKMPVRYVVLFPLLECWLLESRVLSVLVTLLSPEPGIAPGT